VLAGEVAPPPLTFFTNPFFVEPTANLLPYSGAPTYGYTDNQSPTVSLSDWLVTILLSCIPRVGFIMLFVWAFSSSTPPSKANWAKATLVFFLVVVVLGGLFAGSIVAMLATASHR
jgi:hypothetical protein